MREIMIKFLLMLAKGIKFLAWFISRLIFDTLYYGVVAAYCNFLILAMILITILVLPIVEYLSKLLFYEERNFIETVPFFEEGVGTPILLPLSYLLPIGLVAFVLLLYIKYRDYIINIEDFRTLRKFISCFIVLRNLYPGRSMQRSIKENIAETREELKKIREQAPAVIGVFIKFLIIFFVGSSLKTVSTAEFSPPPDASTEFHYHVRQSAAFARNASDSAGQAADSAKRSASSAAEAKQAARSAKGTPGLSRKSSDSDKAQESSFGFFVFFTEEAGMRDLKEDSKSFSVAPNPTYKQQLKKFITGLPSDCENGKCYPIMLEIRGFASSSEWDFDNNLEKYKENIEYCGSNFNQNNALDKKCFGKDGEFHKEDCSDLLNVCTANLRAMNVRSELNDALDGNDRKTPNIELKVKKWRTYSEMEKERDLFADHKDGQFDKNLGLVNRRVEIRLKKIPERLDLSTEEN